MLRIQAARPTTGHQSSAAARLAAPRSVNLQHRCTCKAVSEDLARVSSNTVEQIKQRVRQLAGSKYGHDLDAASRQEIQMLADELDELCPTGAPAELPLSGTTWSLLYTTSDGTSSGKVGPFIAEVSQVFPASHPGRYTNLSKVGLVQAALEGEYHCGGPETIQLEFKQLSLAVGPVTLLTRPFAPGSAQGFWKMTYADGDMRVFYTNKGNLFIMARDK